jgi:hypothetical protein
VAKIHNLQSHCIVFVESIFQPANRLEIDETRNNKAHGFERSDRCNSTQIFRTFPRQSKRKAKIFQNIDLIQLKYYLN